MAIVNLAELPEGKNTGVKLRSGKYLIAGSIIRERNRIYISFPYNKSVLEEVKTFEDRKWHGFDEKKPRKVWSFPITPRNVFKWEYLCGGNPYAHYDKKVAPVTPTRDCLREHQRAMLDFAITRRHCLLAAEMGTGKTLVAIEAMEWYQAQFGLQDYEAWYVGPRSGVMAVGRELKKWDSGVRPRMFTYEKMVKELRDWQPDQPAPKVIIFDESSKLKTPTAQRTQHAQHIADAIRDEHGFDSLIIEMTGSPSPKAPTDWWSQCEIACPGFLRESNIHQFKRRLCLIKDMQGLTGTFPKLITWWDDEEKCSECGTPKFNHSTDVFADHTFKPSVNEVSKLYRRMDGLVTVLLKKDCTDLPDKQYEVIKIKPPVSLLRSAQLIRKSVTRAVTALALLRELSDGFQYEEQGSGEMRVCPVCDGTGTIATPVYEGEHDFQDSHSMPEKVTYVDGECPECTGEGQVTRYVRVANEAVSPKDQIFKDLLDEHSEIGRFVVWGGFTATIDRLTKMAHQEGWATLRVDGRGYVGEDAEYNVVSPETLLSALDRSDPNYDELREQYPKVCFVGHPEAGGMALTLTASPTALYYSNSFKGEARIQSEDRIHRLGMDENLGARIIDLVVLPSDQLVIDNLKEKKKLQNLTMGSFDGAWSAVEREV